MSNHVNTYYDTTLWMCDSKPVPSRHDSLVPGGACMMHAVA